MKAALFVYRRKPQEPAKRAARTHELKIQTEWFQAVQNMGKRGELRKDDRGFCVGDRLILREWLPQSGYTGRALAARIRHILRPDSFNGVEGLAEGYVILSITNPENIRELP